VTEPAHLIDEGEQWVAALARRGLISEPVAATLREAFVQARNERLDAAEDPLLVAMLCGPTAVGKSSLINALAGAEISRPGLGAETPAAFIYVHERDDPARLFEYGQVLGRLGGAEASLIRHARDDLLHKVLVDTPDIDSAVRRHRETTAVLVHCADLVLFVTSPEKYKTMQGAAWIAEQREQRAIAFVLNKWDRDGSGSSTCNERGWKTISGLCSRRSASQIRSSLRFLPWSSKRKAGWWASKTSCRSSQDGCPLGSTDPLRGQSSNVGGGLHGGGSVPHSRRRFRRLSVVKSSSGKRGSALRGGGHNRCSL
jgi:energy-coupling factor transporter ATP-binding protein EcfA2